MLDEGARWITSTPLAERDPAMSCGKIGTRSIKIKRAPMNITVQDNREQKNDVARKCNTALGSNRPSHVSKGSYCDILSITVES